jgi:hypothetical protein
MHHLCIVLCMLPISLVENEGFRDYISYLDPSFNIPSRSKVKNTGIPNLKLAVQNEIGDIENYSICKYLY